MLVSMQLEHYWLDMELKLRDIKVQGKNLDKIL